MKIIYNCYGGSHSSVTAAAIHVGLLPYNRIASREEMLRLPYYDAQIAADHGRIRFMGYDERGHEIYIIGKRNLGHYYERIMRQIINVAQGNQQEFIFVDTMPYVNIFMVIGGFLSRRWGWNRVGRYIILYGTQQSYFKFVHLVNLVKSNVDTNHRRQDCENCFS